MIVDTGSDLERRHPTLNRLPAKARARQDVYLQTYLSKLIRSQGLSCCLITSHYKISLHIFLAERIVSALSAPTPISFHYLCCPYCGVIRRTTGADRKTVRWIGSMLCADSVLYPMVETSVYQRGWLLSRCCVFFPLFCWAVDASAAADTTRRFASQRWLLP